MTLSKKQEQEIKELIDWIDKQSWNSQSTNKELENYEYISKRLDEILKNE